MQVGVGIVLSLRTSGDHGGRNGRWWVNGGVLVEGRRAGGDEGWWIRLRA